MRGLFPLALALALAACPQQNAPTERVHLARLTGTTFELVPGESQLPYCLAFTVAANGVTRQLTMARDNLSFKCPPGKPIGGYAYKVPVDEGPVKVHVLLTSQRVSATSVARQIVELTASESLHPLNLRLPGEASLVTLDFTPEAEVAPLVGQVVTLDAGAPPSDAGAVVPDGGSALPSQADAGASAGSPDGG